VRASVLSIKKMTKRSVFRRKIEYTLRQFAEFGWFLRVDIHVLGRRNKKAPLAQGF
jgi:hypothetical protein